LRFLFLQTHTTHATVSVKKKGGKPETIPPSLWFKESCRNLKSENDQDYAQKHQRNFMFMNSALGKEDYFF
jgi:hypothetical protein